MTQLLTVAQVAEFTQLDRETIIQHIYDGVFPNAMNLGGEAQGKRWRIPQRDLDRWLESRKVTAA